MPRFPIHNYGSDAILNAWRGKQESRKQRDNAITQAILQGASTGNISNFQPGTPAYTGIERKFGSQFTQGLAQRGQQAKAQAQMEQAAKSFDTGMKFFNTANDVAEQLGDKSAPWVKKAYQQAAQNFNAAGMDVDISSLYDAKTNKDNVNKAATKTLSDLVGKLNENSTPQEIAAARLALVKFQEHFRGSGEKEMVSVFDETIAGVENAMSRKQQFERQKKLIQERPKSSSTPAFKKMAYYEWKQKPENKEKSITQFEVEWKQKGIEAKIQAFENNLGRKATPDEMRRLLINDPWGFLAPTGQTQYNSANDVKAAFQRGDLSQEEAASILKDKFGYE
jgi:hypothetical protein